MSFSNRLFVELDASDNWIAMRREVPLRTDDEAWLPLPVGFSLDDVRAAALATGKVIDDAGELRIKDGANTRALGELISEMFSYFVSPTQPTRRLLDVQAAVAEYGLSSDASPQITPWLFAWLDLIVREDLAEDVLSRENIWTDADCVLSLESHCRRRIEEARERYGIAAEISLTAGRMATSARSWSPSERQRTKTG